MELVSPVSFLYAFLHSPLSPRHFSTSPPLTLLHPPTLLALLFLIHYLNRAIISPMRTPSRSKSHIIVPLCAVTFNVVNGSLMGCWLSSPEAGVWTNGALGRAGFWVGVGLWVLGFAGNVWHDEVLLDIRRKAQAKKALEESESESSESESTSSSDGKDKGANGKETKKEHEHYAIPHGYLYNYISYPNYFCEWVEWAGFALAAAPPPPSLSLLFGAPGKFLAGLTPPWLFLLAGFFVMFPRAYRGHKWYHARFPEYPKERRIAIPFLL